jgi:hypothetical protein
MDNLDMLQHELDEMIESDRECYAAPSINQLCDIVAQLIHKWEKLGHQHKSSFTGLGSSSSSSVLGKLPRRESSKPDRHAQSPDTDT